MRCGGTSKTVVVAIVAKRFGRRTNRHRRGIHKSRSRAICEKTVRSLDQLISVRVLRYAEGAYVQAAEATDVDLS